MLIHRGRVIAGGGTIVMPMTRAEYESNKAVLDSADVWVDLTDEPDAVADGEQIVYDSDLNFEDIGNIATKAIAKVEPSDTALYLHNVGDGFINKDGNYCITDVQISVGGTITLGTNCHVVDGGISSKLIKRGTPINATTDANGNVDLGIKVSEKILLNAWLYSSTSHCRCILWASSASEPTWYITAVSNGAMAQSGNLAVTINYVYINAT